MSTDRSFTQISIATANTHFLRGIGFLIFGAVAVLGSQRLPKFLEREGATATNPYPIGNWQECFVYKTISSIMLGFGSNSPNTLIWKKVTK